MTNYYKYQGNISSRFSSNSERKASELLKNHEEMFTQYYIHLTCLIFQAHTVKVVKQRPDPSEIMFFSKNRTEMLLHRYWSIQEVPRCLS